MEIKIKLEDSEIKKCREFAEKVLDETYNRFNKSDKERVDRIFYGKVGEVVFLKFLNSNNIFPDVSDMFQIFEGETNVDKFDFKTKGDKTIDIKTAYKPYHKRILVPEDQFEGNKNKDYYIGIMIDDSLKYGEILGFCTCEDLKKNGKINFGEGFAYWKYLSDLEPIENLLKLF